MDNRYVQEIYLRRDFEKIAATQNSEQQCCHYELTNRLCLNGEWDFLYFKSYRDIDITLPANKIPVPGCVQYYGYDAHQYTNVRYPIPFDPPFVPDDTPAMYYRRTFSITCNSREKVYIDFAGVDNFYYLFINGSYVGFHAISHEGARFDITPFVCGGENTVELIVLKWSSNTYFEDQDKMRLSGIFGDVFVYIRPEAHLTDFFIKADVNIAAHSAKLCIEFADKLDKRVRVYGHGFCCEKQGGEAVSFELENVRLWSAESPFLYDVEIECAGEKITLKYAVRRLEIVNGVVCLNGSKLKLRGVNRHESYFDSGYTVSREKIDADLILMKRFNINAVRTSHYPNVPYFYEACDRLGLYVIDEADIEAHGVVYAGGEGYQTRDFDILADDLAYYPIIGERILRMVRRDKNFGCILMWSLGNESGWGECFKKAAKEVERFDPSRLVHYESIYTKKKKNKKAKELKIMSQMYPPFAQIDKFLAGDDRPLVLCEYCHAMGNGPGDLADYERLFDANDRLCGGFIWEWNDHAAPAPAGEHVGKPLYGGDFGERIHDGNFCCDGLLSPLRVPHTGLYEAAQVFSPVYCTLCGGDLSVENRLAFTDLSALFYGEICYKSGGEPVTERFELPSVRPYERAAVKGVLPPVFDELTVSFFTLADAEYAPKGHRVYYAQLKCREDEFAPLGADFKAEDCGDSYRVKTASGELCISKRTGLPCSIKAGGAELLKDVAFNLTRAYTDNDMPDKWRVEQMNLDDFTLKLTGIRAGGALEFGFKLCGRYAGNIGQGTIAYRFSPRGARVTVTFEKSPHVEFLPRFGLKFTLSGDLNDCEYFGYGPFDSYVDKRCASVKDRFAFQVSENLCEHVKPQEYGSHYDCGEVSLSGGGKSIKIEGRGFSFSALPFSKRELSDKKHNYELVKSGDVHFCLDCKMSGVGSHACGPKLSDEYAVKDDVLRLDFNLIV